ncbi:adenine phosphoribosyltransferase [Urinicoccus massiliensis]|uniref:adenine phosphoribosyltransferase n=1 Tax=Urinicoccus massiliensis TaxID=1723382 RepID=UPI00050F2F71|nr:adenine phosphoribosyltransferase [Urinicoccus massiliensis]KGF11316.1 adenine phosphoribosyltransferase [Tissierellia bacterium S5-A11]
MDLYQSIRSLKDYPEEGITFRDINPLLKDPKAFQEALDQMVAKVKDIDFDHIVGVEARGFILGAAMAHELKCGFVPVRKPGKLVAEVIQKSYSLEYGQDSLEIQKDALDPGDKVLIVDDLIATGGTSEASKDLVEALGAQVVAFCYLIELKDLDGRKRVEPTPVYSVLQY